MSILISLMKPLIGTGSSSGGGTVDPEGSLSMLITVDSSLVPSSVSDFPLRIEMENLPSEFWSLSDEDGGDKLRAYDSDSNQLPIDVTYYDLDNEVGTLFIKTDLSSTEDTVITLTYDESLSALAVTDTYGRNAVWTDYETVVQFPETLDRTGKSTASYTDLGRNEYIKSYGNELTVSSGHVQGVTYDGSTYVFVTDTSGITKYALSDLTTSVLTNSDLTGDLQTLASCDCDHVCDPCYYNGEIWVAINNYPALSPSQEYIVVVDPDTLTIDRYYEISGLAGEQVSSLTYNDSDGLLWGCNYETGSQIHSFTTSGAYNSSITLGTTKDYAQSITYLDGYFYIGTGSSDNNIYKFTTTGSLVETFYEKTAADESRNEPVSEGFYLSDSLFLQTTEQDWIYALEKLTRYQPWSRLEAETTNYYTPESEITTLTAAVSYKGTEEYQQTVLNYAECGLVIDDGDTIGLYDTNDGWMYPSISYEVFEEVRLGMYYDGTAGRGIYVNGVLGASNTSSEYPEFGDYPNLYVGVNPGNTNELASGYFQNIWLRNEVMSEDWMLLDNYNMTSGYLYSCEYVEES